MKSLLLALVMLFGFSAAAEASDLSRFFRGQRQHNSFRHRQQRQHRDFHRYQDRQYDRRYRYDYYQPRGRYYYPRYPQYDRRSGLYYDPFYGEFRLRF